MPAYPTPLGSFHVRTKTRNPWWYPPNADWAKGAKPIPPGPGNPLGTRWMGLGGGVGIHGTYNSGSIGSAASHGCIRMHLRSAEWLFERVGIGTPVFIVAS
jgi:lipoprotein-anchoring transpeptidase ErfK/SrfK